MLKTGIETEKAGMKGKTRVRRGARAEPKRQAVALVNDAGINEGLTTRTVSAFSVLVCYRPTVARYTVHKDKEDFVLVFGEPTHVDPVEWKEPAEADVWKQGALLDAHDLLETFLKVDDLAAAIRFLDQTGAFLPRAEEFTFSQFQKWQDLARLIRHRRTLEEAAQQGVRTGEAAEALKAIEGNYDSTFFSADQRKDLSEWFRSPPGVRRFIPRTDDAELTREALRPAAMIEFLRPRDQLQQVFLIEPTVTIQAIAAALYADWITGIDWGKCPVCGDLFRIRKSSQKYCINSSCRGTAHMRRYRALPKREPSKKNKAAKTKEKKHAKT